MNSHDVGVTLTDSQRQSLNEAYRKKQSVVLRLGSDQLSGTTRISLTKTQYDKFMEAKRVHRGIELKISQAQVKRVGGSLFSAIVPLIGKVLPIIGSLGLAAASGAISGATQKAVSGAERKQKATPLIKRTTMTYKQYGLNLTPCQKGKMANAVRSKKSVAIRLSHDQLHGSDQVMLTDRQISKIQKHEKLHTGLDLTFSVQQLSQQKGGWIIPLLTSLAGGILPSIIAKFTGKGLVLPGTQGRGRFLGSSRGRGRGRKH